MNSRFPSFPLCLLILWCFISSVVSDYDHSYVVTKLLNQNRNSSIEAYGYFWVLALRRQGHAESCKRFGYRPIEVLDLNWNQSVFETVVSSIQIDSYSSNIYFEPLGIVGCCSPGLWCKGGYCYTSSFGKFSNFGWLLDDYDAQPVFSCKSDEAVERVDIFNAKITNRKVVMTGLNLGSEGRSVDTTVFGEACTDTQICTAGVCRECSIGRPCPKDAICLQGRILDYCFMYCAGPQDKSCPCDSFCERESITVGTALGYARLYIHLCTPQSFVIHTNPPTYNYDVCRAYPDGLDEMSCRVPHMNFYLDYLYNLTLSQANNHNQPNDPSQSNHISNNRTSNNYAEEWKKVLDSTATTVEVIADMGSTVNSVSLAQLFPDPSEVPPLPDHSNLINAAVFSCERHSDCFDNDVCTLDRCDNMTCHFEVLPGCKGLSMTRDVRSQQTAFTYRGYIRNAQYGAHVSFEEQVLSEGTVSPVSHHDDFPVDRQPFHFSFPYFGNLVTKLALNSNGAIQLSPLGNCRSEFGSISCIAYATFTNTISVWASDWDPSAHRDTAVVSLKQTAGDGRPVDGVDATAMHILFSKMYPYGFMEIVKGIHSTFSASLYDDGSIRLRYHQMLAEPQDTDVFGLWGSRASQQSASYTRYHEESVPYEAVQNGTDVTYCMLSIVSCPINSCVTSGGTLQLLYGGNGIGCMALGPGVRLALSCDWMGLAVTPATLRTISHDQSVIECAVPTLPGVSSGTLISVNINIYPEYFDSGSGSRRYSPLDSDRISRTKAVSGTTSGFSGELSKHPLTLRYHAAGADGGGHCGCSPFYASGAVLACDRCLVCGGGNNTVDCNGDCHGVAYEDSCAHCSGGRTSRSPVDSCDFPEDDMSLTTSIISEVVLLLITLFGVMLAFSSVMYLLRVTLHRVPFLHHVEILGIERHLRAGNGMTEEELRQVGSFYFERETDNKPSVRVEAGGSGSANGVAGAASAAEDQVHVIPVGDNTSMNPLWSPKRESSAAVTAVGQHQIPIQVIECPICLAEVLAGDEVRRLPAPCGHLFHKSCIDMWFDSNTSCPMCKRSVRSLLNPNGGDGASLPGWEISRISAIRSGVFTAPFGSRIHILSVSRSNGTRRSEQPSQAMAGANDVDPAGNNGTNASSGSVTAQGFSIYDSDDSGDETGGFGSGLRVTQTRAPTPTIPSQTQPSSTESYSNVMTMGGDDGIAAANESRAMNISQSSANTSSRGLFGGFGLGIGGFTRMNSGLGSSRRGYDETQSSEPAASPAAPGPPTAFTLSSQPQVEVASEESKDTALSTEDRMSEDSERSLI